ncbi:MAG: GxxExxY protein [Ignavibacteria bacterium]
METTKTLRPEVYTNKGYEPLTGLEEEIATKIVNAAYKVHSNLGPGLLEKIYETCFCYELKKSGLEFKTQVKLPIIYEGITFNEGLVLDVLVEDLVICELKSVKETTSVDDAQLLSHIRLAKKRLGFLINFNVTRIKEGIFRKIL